MRVLVAALALSLALAAPVAAQTPGAFDRAALDASLKALVAEGKVVGVSALVYRHDREVYFGAYGHADREAGRPMARNTRVRIYSMTKPIVGATLMSLYDERRFGLDEPMAKYIPEFADLKVYAGDDANGDPLRVAPRRTPLVRDFTRHTAGIGSGGDCGPCRVWMRLDPLNPRNTLDDYARLTAHVPLRSHPGEKWNYGPSVDAQALMAQRLAGKRFDLLMQERVLDPLGMSHTSYYVPPQDRDELAAGYVADAKGALVRVTDPASLDFNTKPWPLTPGGFGLVSTLDDYARFARMLARGGELDGVRVLKAETVRLMTTDQMPSGVTDKGILPNVGQGLGFGIDFAVRVKPPVAAENPGVVGEYFWFGAWGTLFWVDPKNDMVVVMFIQKQKFEPLHYAMRKAVYDACGCLN